MGIADRVCASNAGRMFSRGTLYILVALGGAGLALQMACNSRLRVATGSPVLATLISVVVTLISLTGVWASGVTPRGTLPAFSSVPIWAWGGGALAGYYLVASLVAIPRLGTAAVFSLVIAGQMITALVLDATGALGVAHIALNVKRVAGAALLLIGVVLLQK
jgi:bacterial/archaeal transporter family-2 protein